MFENMPAQHKAMIRELLEEDNFVAAKALYDQWKKQQQQSS